MNIIISDIKDPGNIMKERVVLKVTQECDLGKYMLSLSRLINDAAFSSKLRELYWFPDQEVKEGDLVVLYTKRGDRGNAINEDGSKTYFFYWGLDNPISDKNHKSCVVLLESSWIIKEIPTESGSNVTIERPE